MRACRRCGRAFVAITLQVAAEECTLLSCSHCDVRMWLTEGQPVARDGVFAGMAADAAARREALARPRGSGDVVPA